MKDIRPALMMGGLFVLTHSLALLVTRPFESAGVVVFENPNDPMNVVYLFLTLVMFTVVILVTAKFWKKQLIQAIILGATGYTAFYVFYPFLAVTVPEVWSLLLSTAAAAVLVIMLLKYPEWYVIDVCCIMIGAVTTATLGISLSIFLTIGLLIGLAVYDAISVRKTKHMIDLADIIFNLRLPIILVMPKTRGYSLLGKTKSLKEKLRDDKERDVFILGLGDVVIPGFLVVSAFHNISNGLPIALSVMLGTLLGFAMLMTSVMKRRPQPGLPYLCSGAIVGYLVSSYLLFGELVGLG